VTLHAHQPEDAGPPTWQDDPAVIADIADYLDGTTLHDPAVGAQRATRGRLTDLGNAERLVAGHGHDLRFAPGIGWFIWDGRRWKRDSDGESIRRMKQTVRGLYAEAAELNEADDRKKLTSWAVASESEARLRAAVKLAETERPVIVEPKQLDAEPWLFNAANGTIDLRTGQLREHRRDDLLTRISPVVFHPEAHSDLWESSLERATRDKEGLAAFLQRAVGYSATGHTREDKLFFAHGPTATGKSTVLEAIKSTLGDYATTADFETFLKRRGDAGIRNDIARLDGARLVISIEVDEGKALAEGLVKMLTGGDTVAARFLYHETFEFLPVFKLWLAANTRPRANADDGALWRRILLVPFTEVIPEAERDERVRIELRTSPEVQSAILAWAVKGCLEWQKHGLKPPACVLDYTDDYRAENDPLREWLADSCQLDPEAWTSAAELRTSYETWCETNGEKPVGPKKLAATLTAKNCTSEKATDSTRGWKGIHVR
jgi:putative DNA primase/helicase